MCSSDLEIEKDVYDDAKGPSGEGVPNADKALLRDGTRELVAAGELVAQRQMKPGEKLETQRVVFVNSESGYDFLETRVYFPSLIVTSSKPSEDHLFYAFLDRLDERLKPWDKKALESQPSKKVNALALVSLTNAWCEIGRAHV